MGDRCRWKKARRAAQPARWGHSMPVSWCLNGRCLGSWGRGRRAQREGGRGERLGLSPSFSQISAQKLSWSVEMRPGGTPISRSCMSPWYSKLCASAQLVATSRSTGSLRAPPGPLILCPWVDRILIPISRAEGELVDTFMVLRLAAAATPSCCSARRTAALPAELLLRPPSCCPRREPSCWRTPS
ncbi:hypothetical protein T492DRAFT_435861 [Pavlovales sp. CCMP2436]|nr:hypothetical protein T492DRAFT_435861 [Pavlovales sp. CCMP2436]